MVRLLNIEFMYIKFIMSIQIISLCIFSLYLIYLIYTYFINNKVSKIKKDKPEQNIKTESPSQTQTKIQIKLPPNPKINSKINFSFNNEISQINQIIKDDLNRIKNQTIREMSLYGADGGKRVRALIISKISKVPVTFDSKYDLTKQDMLRNAMLFIEYLHASSLIMDDIMDGDTSRRGRQCTHIKYGSTMAQITSIYLLSTAFVHLNQFNSHLDNKTSRLVSTIIFNNFHDLSDGQFIDLLPSAGENIDKLISEKTSTLFQMSYVLGYVLKHKNTDNSKELFEEKIEKVKHLSDLFGKIFQISDDFDDYEKDKNRGTTANYIISKGRETAISYYHALVSEYNKLSTELDLESLEISEIIEYLSKVVI